MNYYRSVMGSGDWTATELEEHIVLFSSKKGLLNTAMLNFKTQELILYKGNRLEIKTDHLKSVPKHPYGWRSANIEDALDIALLWVREETYNPEIFKK